MLSARGKHARERPDLVLVRHNGISLVNCIHRGGLGGDRNLYGILQMLACNLLNRGGHRRAKQRGQAIIRSARRDCLNVLGKAHAQHLIGLVEDQHAHVRQIQRALLDKVDDATRRANDDLSAALECTDLGAVGRAAIHGNNVEAGSTSSKILNRLGALHGELTGGRQNEGLHVTFIGIDNCQQWQAESRGLSGTRLGDADDVTQLEQRWDGSSLNRGGNAESHVGNGREDLLGQTEAREGHGVLLFLVRVLINTVIVESTIVIEIVDVIGNLRHFALGVSAVLEIVRGHNSSLRRAIGVSKTIGAGHLGSSARPHP